MDLVKMGYKIYLEEGVGILFFFKVLVVYQEGYFVLNEGWVFRVVKKVYRFSEK